MSLIRTLITASVLSVSFNANAALTSYTGTDGVGLVYSSVSDLTWTQDANLLATLDNSLGYDNVVDAIIASSPTITDTPNIYDNPSNTGYHVVTSADFHIDGTVSWFGAHAFINYLNTISFGGSNQWRLPNLGKLPLSANYRASDNEFGLLFFSELNNIVENNLINSDFFDNEQILAYWSKTEYDTEYDIDYGRAWVFITGNGVYPDRTYKNSHLFAWAVTPGQVTAVPLPTASWLMLTGLLGCIGFKRSKNKVLFDRA